MVATVAGVSESVPLVVVVCTGNICRSPLAAALLANGFARRGMGVEVTSAGTAAPVGAAPDRNLLRVADDLGLDLRSHRAQRATPELLATSDLVLALTAGHAAEVRVRAGRAAITTLLAAARRAPHIPARSLGFAAWVQRLTASYDEQPAYVAGADDIADPYGGPRRAYRRMAAEVDGAVTQLLSAWD